MVAQMKAGPWGLTVMKRRREPTERVLPARILAAQLKAETRVLQEMCAPSYFFCCAYVVFPAGFARFGSFSGKALSLKTLHESSASLFL